MRTLCLFTILLLPSLLRAEPPARRELPDIIGSSHVAGWYHFTDGDFLNEGADVVLGMGSRVIKVWFLLNPRQSYRFNSEWPQVTTLVELAKTPYYRALFAKPFTTFILEATDGLGSPDYEREKQRSYDIARYFLTEYKGTGKTFILQNWEGDWVLTPPGTKADPKPQAVERMIGWLNARQDGIERARREVGTDGVMVAHAAEVNLVAKAMEGKKSVTNDVLPQTHCDLYSYSAYDTSLKGPREFRAALDYLKQKAPDSRLFGPDNIMVGEFGAPENSHAQRDIVKWTTQSALDFGARYIVYWQTYCNELKGGSKSPPPRKLTNDDLRGFWLIRADGTKSPAYEYFATLLAPDRKRASTSSPATASSNR